jgi:hypothetical protein
MGYLRILGAIPGFFLSALILMLLWNTFALDIGLDKIGYVMAMLLNITLWLAVAPLAAVARYHFWGMFGIVPGFFLSSLFLMFLWRSFAPEIGLSSIEYPMAMLVTITLWLAIGPLVFTSFHFPWHK